MKLNPQQQLAINTIDGPVMVIAGPGTGKTQIIAERIANILKKTDTAPDSILALTFTESGAKAMRERLIQTIGETAYYVNIATFHSFCSQVIRDFPDHFADNNAAEPLAELERVEIFHQIIDQHQFNYLKPVNNPYYYTSGLITAIQELKREGVSPSDLKKILDLEVAKTSEQKYQLKKNLELLKIYSAYQKALLSKNRYDFEDMINLVVKAFSRDEALLRTYQERLQYFLVDEYQDTNSSQHQVLQLLASYWGQEANVFVVGDPNQSIYRFQGASLENFIRFTEIYPRAKIISLEKNYRSPQLILDAAYALIQKNSLKLEDIVKTAKPKLVSQSKVKDTPIQVIKLPSETVEAYWVAQKIKSLIKLGIKPEAISVLYRHNQDAAAFANMLVKLGVPVEIEGGADVLKDPVINQLLVLFKAISHSTQNLEDLELFTLMHYPWFNLDSLEILKLSRQAAKTKRSLIDLILAGKAPESFNQLVVRLARWRQADCRLNFSQWFERLVKDSGFMDFILSQPNSVNLLNRLNSLFGEIKRLNSLDHQLNLSGFLKALDLMAENKLVLSEQDLDIKSQAVSLSTVHKAKGKEWDYVFIVKAIDNKWGNNLSRDLIKLPASILVHSSQIKKEPNEDERRLFYVALTRAKKEVYLTYSEHYLTGDYLKETIPTMFLSQIPAKFQVLVEPRFSPQAKEVLWQFLTPSPQPEPTIQELDWLKALVADFRLSATALNTYLTCPYKFKLNVLVRIPRAKADYLAFGSAIHKALEEFYRDFLRKGRHPGKEFLLVQFEQALARETLTDSVFQSKLNYGRQILSAYYDFYRDDFIKPLFIEKDFGRYTKIFLDDIPLSGKIDRIELINLADKTIRVVDYKTGNPKTRNQILGKTKNSDLDYFRQLVFYRLLIGLDRNSSFKVKEGVLDFIQPDKKSGKFRQEKFLISDQDVENLKATIRSVFKEIRALNFCRTENLSHCRNCEYLHHCWPNGLPQSQQLELVK